MTLHHGIEHLKKHDSAKNRIFAAMLTTILEQLGEDIPLPETTAKPETAKYSVEAPKGIAFAAIASDKYVQPNLDPEALEYVAEAQGDCAARIQLFAETYVSAARSMVPSPKDGKSFISRISGKDSTSGNFTGRPEGALSNRVMYYHSEVTYETDDLGNTLESFELGIDEKKRGSKSALKLRMEFSEGNLTTIGFDAKDGYNLNVFGYLVGPHMKKPDTLGNRYKNSLAFEDRRSGLLDVKDDYYHGTKGEITLEPGKLSYTIESMQLRKKYVYEQGKDGEYSFQSHNFQKNVETLDDKISPDDFVDFAQALLKIIPLQHH